MNEHDGLQEMTGSAPTSSVDDPQGAAVTDERFRRVMAQATGVTVITTQVRRVARHEPRMPYVGIAPSRRCAWSRSA
jgi:hypothetical protein